MKVTHIVPTVPPAFNGLGDYAMQLWRHWPDPKPEWHAVCRSVPTGAEIACPELFLHQFEPNEASLVKALKSAGSKDIVLHYVPHAYHSKGIPFWLPAPLAQWKKQTGGRLTVMFHELYAIAPLWRITGWLTPIAKRTMLRILNLSDRWATSCDRYYGDLLATGLTTSSKGILLPIGSNIDPVEQVPADREWPLGQGRRLRVAVFGFAGTRLAAVLAHRDLLAAMQKEKLLECVVLIGKRPTAAQAEEMSRALEQVGAPCLEEHFDVGQTDGSKAIASADLGLAANIPDIITKSGTYAAYCVHGVIPIVAIPHPFDGAGQAFLANPAGSVDDTILSIRSEPQMRDLRSRILTRANTELSWDHIVSWYAAAPKLAVAL